MEKKITCTKCDGSGYLSGYKHILNGICFTCGGSGYKIVKATYKPSQNYGVQIFADFHGDGKPFRGQVFVVKARTPGEAKRKATMILSRGCYADCVDSISIL